MYSIFLCFVAGGRSHGVCDGFWSSVPFSSPRSSTPQQQELTARMGAHPDVWVAPLSFVQLHLSRNEFYGMAIGAMALAASYAAGPVSGGLLNPAITIGLEPGRCSCSAAQAISFILHLEVWTLQEQASLRLSQFVEHHLYPCLAGSGFGKSLIYAACQLLQPQKHL